MQELAVEVVCGWMEVPFIALDRERSASKIFIMMNLIAVRETKDDFEGENLAYLSSACRFFCCCRFVCH